MDVENIRNEIILDSFSSKLWNQFKQSFKLSKNLLQGIQDLFVKDTTFKFSHELRKKLYCTRFFCGLSESRKVLDNGKVQYLALDPLCVDHAKGICEAWPSTLTKQPHFISLLKLQVILSACRAGNVEEAKKHFKDLFEGKEKYQDEARNFLRSKNEKLREKILEEFSYETFLKQAVEFLQPVFANYDTYSFLEKLEEQPESMDEQDKEKLLHHISRICHDQMVSEDDDASASWDSIVNGTHLDIQEFKLGIQDKQKDKNDSLSAKEVTEKAKQVRLNLEKSSEELHNYIQGKNKEGTSPQKKNQSDQRPANRKKRWNAPQEEEERVEWTDSDDSEEELNHRPKLCLRTPQKGINLSRPQPKRRKKNPWTDDELDWLKKGVKSYGEGNWSVILRMFPFRKTRTGTDLKDKWRNVSRKRDQT